MTARILTGSKQEIAEKVARLDGQVREAIVFVEEPVATQPIVADIFAERERYTVHQNGVGDARDAIYERGAGE